MQMLFLFYMHIKHIILTSVKTTQVVNTPNVSWVNMHKMEIKLHYSIHYNKN